MYGESDVLYDNEENSEKEENDTTIEGKKKVIGGEMKTEKSMMCPTNPYAATKCGAELLAMSYYYSFSMPIIISRGNNVFGPLQFPEKLIPRFVSLLKSDHPVTIQGDGSCIRSFLHVADVVKAFDLILERGNLGEIYNIGGDTSFEYSVMEIAHKLIGLLKPNDPVKRWIEYVPDRPFNDKRYFISNDKLLALGWSPSITLDEGLALLLAHQG